MDVFLLIIFGLTGLCVGSFLNVVIDRLPAGRSLMQPPSHCPGCGRRIDFFDLVPVLSYIRLRGRCRKCGAPIPRRVPVVEALTGAMFPISHLLYGYSPNTLYIIFYYCIFSTLLVIDLEQGIIPNKIVYPASIISLFISFFRPEIGPGSALTGGIIGLVVFLAITVISRGGMGMGDVKMATLVGLVTGFPLVTVGLFLAVVIGGMVAVALLALHRKKSREAIPFGPFLSLATLITLVWGDKILNCYLIFFGF
jgi:leader peptidase (prepilin peptidase) / N-methyltransferase